MSNLNEIKQVVCHVTSVHQRYDVRIFHKQCKSLAANGYQVVLLVNDNIPNEFTEGIKIISTNFQSKNRIDRMLNSNQQIKKKILDIDAEIYHFHDPELLPVAWWTKRKGKKVIFDFHEDVTQQILFKPWIPKLIRRATALFYSLYESVMVKKFDGVISVTPKIVNRLKIKNSKCVMITNYPILKNNVYESSNLKENAVCFAGGISPQWNHENIILAIENIDDIKYVLAGRGNPQYMEKLQSYKAWNKVEYLGKIPHEEVNQIYSKSMIGLALLSFDTQVGDEGTLGNTKVFEFMEAGLPIICSNNKIWAKMIEKYKCGKLVDPSDINGIREAVISFIENPDEAKRAGVNGRRAVEAEYNWKTQESNLLSFYELINK